MGKPTVAFFDFTCCEGCQLCALDLEPQQMLDLVELVDIVEFREVSSDKAQHYDIAFIEGSIARQADIDRIKDIRARTKTLVTLGACSTIAGVNALRNFFSNEECMDIVYANELEIEGLTKSLAIDEVVKVDAIIPGCPIDTGEFLRVLKNLVLGKRTDLPTCPVCTECKMNENICVYEKGMHCLGPIIRSGCNARCPSNGGYCFGCRGVVPKPNIKAQEEMMMEHGLSFDDMRDKFKLFLERNKEIFPDDKN